MSSALVDELTTVKLVVIDEVSTCGAVALEVTSRRTQQVAQVLWRRRFRCAPPDLGPFGGAGVLLMGDFAKLLRRSECPFYDASRQADILHDR